jgi:pyruvate/2-oxoglutarate dehydrogenase complex dihydrolipoamide acyltransferase (E2) component
MGLFSRNISYRGEAKLTAFRKVALGTWRTVGDPSVYAELIYDVEPALKYLDKVSAATGSKLTMTHFVGKACAETIRRHPELNCILRWGKLYRRSDIDIFFQVASDTKGEDLSGTTVRRIDQKNICEIATDMQKKVKRIRDTGDVDYKEMKKTMRLIPAWFSRYLLDLSSYIMYTLNLWSPLLGVPKDPFGSIMITSLGSIGLDRAFVPLVPYSRIPCLIAIGSIRRAPWVVDDQVLVKNVVSLSVTFDHRVIDGMHASHMARTLKKIFAHPEQELGFVESRN